MKIRNLYILLGLLGCLLLGLPDDTALAQAQEYKVIVNTANPTTSLTKSALSKLFMKKTPTWSKNQPVQPVDLDVDSPTRIRFSEDIHGKSAAAVKAYWQRKAFSGRATVPPEEASDAEVVAFVEDNPGAIGYVSASATLTNVKIITLTD